MIAPTTPMGRTVVVSIGVTGWSTRAMTWGTRSCSRWSGRWARAGSTPPHWHGPYLSLGVSVGLLLQKYGLKKGQQQQEPCTVRGKPLHGSAKSCALQPNVVQVCTDPPGPEDPYSCHADGVASWQVPALAAAFLLLGGHKSTACRVMGTCT